MGNGAETQHRRKNAESGDARKSGGHGTGASTKTQTTRAPISPSHAPWRNRSSVPPPSTRRRHQPPPGPNTIRVTVVPAAVPDRIIDGSSWSVPMASRPAPAPRVDICRSGRNRTSHVHHGRVTGRHGCRPEA